MKNREKNYEDILFSNKELFSIERDYNERLIYKLALCEASKKHPLNYKFVELYPKIGYVDAIRLVLWFPMLRENLKDCLITFYRLPFLFLRKIYTIFIKKIYFV